MSRRKLVPNKNKCVVIPLIALTPDEIVGSQLQIEGIKDWENSRHNPDSPNYDPESNKYRRYSEYALEMAQRKACDEKMWNAIKNIMNGFRSLIELFPDSTSDLIAARKNISKLINSLKEPT